MNKQIFKIISCPYDKDTFLELTEDKIDGLEIYEGVLSCPSCERIFPIINKIPYLLPDDLIKTRKEVKIFFEKKVNFKKRIKYGFINENKIEWKEGKRVWHPDFISGVITALKRKNPPDEIQNYFKQAPFSLDVGCGEHPKGDVNVDIYTPSNIPKNFILASAEYLPFRKNTFDLVHSSYVIEHCLNPAQFIEDQIHCSKEKVLVIGDNCEWIGDDWCRITGNGRIFHDEHCYAWTVEYLGNLIHRMGYRGEVKALNLSPTYITMIFSQLGRIPRAGRLFFRDIMAIISK